MVRIKNKNKKKIQLNNQNKIIFNTQANVNQKVR